MEKRAVRCISNIENKKLHFLFKKIDDHTQYVIELYESEIGE